MKYNLRLQKQLIMVRRADISIGQKETSNLANLEKLLKAKYTDKTKLLMK